METVEAGYEIPDKLADIGLVLRILKEEIIKSGPHNLDDVLVQTLRTLKSIAKEESSLNELFRLLPTEAKRKVEAQTIYLSYLNQMIEWTTISILSASYISALVLIRTVLELLINASAEETGGMRKRIASIQYLKSDERKEIENNWDELCGWGHPYGRWLNEACPVFISKGPRYHPHLVKICVNKLLFCIDLALTIAVYRFEMKPEWIVQTCENYGIAIESFPMLRQRVKR